MSETCAEAQVISTIQARVGGEIPSARTPFPVGASFRWHGAPVPLAGARAALRLTAPLGHAALRAGASRAVAKREGGAAPLLLTPPEAEPDALIVTDGRRRWSAELVLSGSGETLLVFPGGAPPANADLSVVQSPTPRAVPAPRETICFTAGTRIATPDGPRPVEFLYPGDRVRTRDDGVREILWVGMRRLSPARLFAAPDLRPVRIPAGAFGNTADLVVSPGHRLLLSGPRVRALWNTPEVLARAGDLTGEGRATRDREAADTTYVHLLLGRHAILRANGAWCESFHPGDADLGHLEEAALADLLALVPGIDTDPAAYGPPARRHVSAAELAIGEHAGAPRYLAG